MNQQYITVKIDLRENPTINSIIQLVKHMNKNLSSSGSKPRIKN